MKDRLFIPASGFYNLYRPSLCERRVFLVAHDEPQGPASEFDTILKELGERHEKEHLATFPVYKDLSEGSHADRVRRTKDAVSSGAPVIYQGVLRAAFPGSRDLVTGIPDFMILDKGSCRIRDCKLSRRMEAGTHPEIALQLQAYGWLFETTFGTPPSALEAYLRDRTIVSTPYLGAERAVEDLGRIRDLWLLEAEPYEPVGWTKCNSCAFQVRCWTRAEAAHDVSILYKVDQGLTRALRDRSIATYDKLLETMDVRMLAQLKKPHGSREQKVGVNAARILAQARALSEKRVIPVGDLRLPAHEHLVMFDLEGVTPLYEELDEVYLWGLQVYGRGGVPGPYRPAVAGFGPDGDREGWKGFLENARQVFESHGDIPFVHWHGYEITKLKSYIDRFGDRDGIGERVLGSCFDLLAAVRGSFALPVPSYSLKVIEQVAGFRRTMEEYGGSWSIGRYIRARESGDEAERGKILEEILRYNEEDLQATWAVFQWAEGLAKART